MGTTTLRQFLQSLCRNSFWNYAVFWKLQHQSQVLLTWEDGFCDIPKQGESMESIFDNICFEGLDDMSSSNCESSTYDVELAVGYMSSIQYALGDGVVGEVAYTGNYHWVFSEKLLSGELNSMLVPKCPDEWLFQFAAGIKTILLVPVVPHGVLQLGSMNTIVEDLALVAYIKDKFVAHLDFVGYSETFAINREFLAQSPSLLIATLIDNLDELSALTTNEMKTEDSMANYNVHKQSTKIQITPPSKAQDTIHISGADVLKISNGSTQDDAGAHLVLIEVPEPLNYRDMGMMESSMYRCLEEELPAFSYSKDSNMGVFGAYANKTTKSDRLMNQPLIVDKDADNVGHRNVAPFLSFPTDCELHKALGPPFMGKTNDYIRESSISDEDVYSSSSMICDSGLICGTRPSARGLVNSDDAEQLLESVVANMHLDQNSSNKTDCANSSMTSLGQFTASSEGQNKTKRSALGSEEGTLPRNHVTSACVNRRRYPITGSLSSSTSYESVMSELIEEEQEKKYGYLHQTKESKLSGASKRRGRSGINQKPRPRDRQLIQDRLKELRELVPNGAKCSIDGLLDRTISHMLFLRSVSGRADKLKQWVHQEVAGLKNMKPPESKGDSQNGSSWAFELGSEQQICPIIVEDLEYPGHMSIEMICDENGRFLEIADVIHRLDLTILKGVMERRSGNTWANFVIEAPRGLHRLDIFWPLMQLLQQNQSSISSKI